MIDAVRVFCRFKDETGSIRTNCDVFPDDMKDIQSDDSRHLTNETEYNNDNNNTGQFLDC